jgi:hypothetical protein
MRVRKKNVRWFALLIAAVLSSLSITAPLAENLAFQQVLPLYTAPPTNNPSESERIQTEQRQQLIRLQNGAYGKPENFTAKVHLAFKKDKRPVVASIWPFVFQAPTEGSLVNGWRGEESSYSWGLNMDAKALPLTIPLVPENGAKPFQLREFNEFWLDYAPSPGMPLCIPNIEFKFSIPQYGSKALQVMAASAASISGSNMRNFKSLKIIGTERSNWKEKDHSYLVSRVLGFAPDEDWRYVQSQKNGVMQRRMHIQLDNVELLEIAVAPGTIINRINMLIGQEDNYSAGELVEFANPKNITLQDGRQVIHLNLREALEKIFAKESTENLKEPGKYHFYLQEIFIYIPGKAFSISKKKPVESLNFLRQVKDKRTQISESMFQRVTLASSFIIENSFRHRMVVDLNKLAEKGRANLKSTKLLLLPPIGATSCAIRIKEKQLVSTYSGNIPSFARVVEDWSRHRGRLFNATPPQGDHVESPGIIGYFPLSTLAQDARQDGRVGVVIKPGANLRAATLLPHVTTETDLLVLEEGPRAYSILGLNGKEIASDKRRLISSIGANLRATASLPNVTTENDLLVLEGRSRTLEISWPLTAHINDKTLFYFGVGEGVEQTGSIRLTLDLADGSVVQQQVVPNQPLYLMAGEAEVRNIRLLILPTVIPYRFKLREMALFAPAAASYAQAFSLPLPTQYNLVPKPVLQFGQVSVLEVKPGRISGMAFNESLRFSTPLDPPLDWASGVRLNYNFPPTYTDEKACSLSLQFNWENGKTERQVCFEQPNGVLYIPMANFIGATDKPQNLGALRSIDWALRSATYGDRGLPESFDLQFSVDGWAMASAADHLRLSPLFNVGRYPVFADAEHNKEGATRHYARKIWLPLKDKALPRMLAAGREIRPVEDWLFTLDQVMVEPSQPMSRDRWHELTVRAVPYTSPRWPKWLAWFSVVLLILVTWKKGWWSPGKAWALGKGSVKVLTRILRGVLGVAGRWSWHALPYINLAIGLLALGPGLFLAGWYGLNFAGIMLISGSILLAWGAYCLWREQTEQHHPVRSSAMRARFIVLAVALGAAIWSLAQYKLGTQALWGFLPLLGAIYTFLPALYRLGLQLVLNYRGYVFLGGWLALALALYGGSLLVKVGSEENYLFNFGTLALLFALRASLLMLAPHFRRFFPATAERVYGGAGSLYFYGALVMLVATVAVLSVKLQPIAEQLAIIAYYSLIIGTVQAVWALCKRDKKIVEIPSSE